MMTFGRFTAVALLLAVAGCALPTTQKYEAKLEPLIGMPVDDLVLKWGPPQSSFTMGDGRTVIEYSKSELVASGGGTSFGIGGGSRGPSIGTGVSTSFPVRGGSYGEGRHCKTRFIVSKERVVQAWSWEGNHCVSY